MSRKGDKSFDALTALTDALSEQKFVGALVAALAPALDSLYGARMVALNTAIIAQQHDIAELKTRNTTLFVRLTSADKRIDELENAASQDVLIFKGVPERSYAERASSTTDATAMDVGTGSTTSYGLVEETVRDFCQSYLKVAVGP